MTKLTKACDICNEIITLDCHHIQSSCYGGLNVDWNKCGICPNCHRKVHGGEIIIEGWFSTTSKMGRTLIWRNKNHESITGADDPKVWLYGESYEKPVDKDSEKSEEKEVEFILPRFE